MGWSPGLNSIHPGSTSEAPIGLMSTIDRAHGSEVVSDPAPLPTRARFRLGHRFHFDFTLGVVTVTLALSRVFLLHDRDKTGSY